MADPMTPPAPVIQASSSSVAVGENLHISCSVVGEQDVIVDFTWEYPGQQVRNRELIPIFGNNCALSVGLTKPFI